MSHLPNPNASKQQRMKDGHEQSSQTIPDVRNTRHDDFAYTAFDVIRRTIGVIEVVNDVQKVSYINYELGEWFCITAWIRVAWHRVTRGKQHTLTRIIW